MFWIGLVLLVLFLTCCCDMDLGTTMLWVAVYCIVAVGIDFVGFVRRP